VEAHYAPLRVPEAILDKVVQLTEDYLLSRYQPSKSIRLLDEACAWSIVQDPPLTELTEEALAHVLENTVGRGVVHTEPFDMEDVRDQLLKRIVGQDHLMSELAYAFVAGMGTFKKEKGPRGSFFFAGPTGVGKTWTALTLAEILGGGRDVLLRIDCNTLQGSGHDSQPAINRLLGPPPGYVGYVRGEGGILSKIRDIPEAVVLFDEIEKADPGISKTLLQILGQGTVRDADDNLLDFRRSFLIFTSNAGVSYGSTQETVGFQRGRKTSGPIATVTQDSVEEDLRDRGVPQEFLGRGFKWFIFEELTRDDILVVIERQLASLVKLTELHGYRLEWNPELVGYLADRWEPQFGVRHLDTIVKNRITEQLSVADAQGELHEINRIRLSLSEHGDTNPTSIGGATRRCEGDTLIIELA